MIQLSIIIPSYNVERYLKNTVFSFLSDKINDEIEIIIVNDGSKDQTLEIALELEREYNALIKVIDKKNGGHGSTINRGIIEAKGRYFKVVDGDDWVDTENLVKCVERLRKINSDVVFTPFTRVNIEDGVRENIGDNVIPCFEEMDFCSVIGCIGESYQMHSLFFKTEIIKKISSIDEHCFYVDQEYILYPVAYLSTIIAFPFHIYQYRVGVDEQSVSVISKQKNREMHKKVIESLIQFKKAQKHTFNKEVYDFINVRLGNLAAHQVEIYLSMNISNEVKKELQAFLNEVQMKDKEVFDSIPGKNTKLLLKSHYILYPIISWYFKMKRGINHE